LKNICRFVASHPTQPRKPGAISGTKSLPAFEKSAKNACRKGMNQRSLTKSTAHDFASRLGRRESAENNSRARLRDLGCPDTLIKDVRDVAAAVCNSEGPGRSGEKKLNRLGIQAI
jgi:hypothetical protein